MASGAVTPPVPGSVPDPRQRPAIACVGANEFLIASHTGNTTLGVFVTESGDPCRGTLEWASNVRSLGQFGIFAARASRSSLTVTLRGQSSMGSTLSGCFTTTRSRCTRSIHKRSRRSSPFRLLRMDRTHRSSRDTCIDRRSACNLEQPPGLTKSISSTYHFYPPPPRRRRRRPVNDPILLARQPSAAAEPLSRRLRYGVRCLVDQKASPRSDPCRTSSSPAGTESTRCRR